MNILYPLAKRFIAGSNFESARPVIESLIEEGYEVSVDYLGELSKTRDDCDRAAEQYIKIINFYKKTPLDISIKPSQLGLLIHPLISYEHLDKIAKLAKKHKHTIRLDMEDSKDFKTDLTRNLAMSLNKKYGNVGVAIQANLFRTEEDLKILIDHHVSVRLVKGAYRERDEIAHHNEIDVAAHFFHYAATLYSRKAEKPAIATHDEELIEDIQELIPNPKYFDYEFLYGIRRDLQKSLLKNQYKVRIYVPFGTDWFPYTLRRLREWKNLKFLIKNIFKEWV
jgi:proline dehydrogenase|tara:strand:+ start:1326 stop:2168 length:843 start_codon:yes stop_codon:yes gene_type:complete